MTEITVAKISQQFELTGNDWCVLSQVLYDHVSSLEVRGTLLKAAKKGADEAGELDEWQVMWANYQSILDELNDMVPRFAAIHNALHEGAHIVIAAVSEPGTATLQDGDHDNTAPQRD